MYKSLIRPVVLYGHETSTMLEEDLQALGVFEQRVQEDGVCRRRMKHELAKLFGLKLASRKSPKLKGCWAGHVVKMPDINPAKTVFITNPASTRRRRTQDHI